MACRRPSASRWRWRCCGQSRRPSRPSRMRSVSDCSTACGRSRRARRCWSRSTTSNGSIARPPTRSHSPCDGSNASPWASCSPGVPGAGLRSSACSSGPSSSAWRSARCAWARRASSYPSGSGLSLSRHLLRRIVESTLGNPLFVLEFGRTLVEQGLPEIGRRSRCRTASRRCWARAWRGLSDGVRRLLLAVSLSADLRVAELRAIGPTEAVEDAVDAGVLVIDGARVRASHPLLAAVARKRSRPRERRELHLVLAGVVADEELRALHAALATVHADPELADTVVACGGERFRARRTAGGRRARRARAASDARGVGGAHRTAARAGRLSGDGGRGAATDHRARSRTRGATGGRATGPRLAAPVGGRRPEEPGRPRALTTTARSRSLKTIRACGHMCSRRRRRIRQLPGSRGPRGRGVGVGGVTGGTSRGSRRQAAGAVRARVDTGTERTPD